MVQATRRLGLPPKTDLPVVEDLVRGYVKHARALEGWQNAAEEGAAQAAFDLAFLGVLAGEEIGKNVAVQKLLAKVSFFPPLFRKLTTSSLQLYRTNLKHSWNRRSWTISVEHNSSSPRSFVMSNHLLSLLFHRPIRAMGF